MTAVENATDEGALEVFSSEDNDDDAEPEDWSVTASVTSRAGHACEQDGRTLELSHVSVLCVNGMVIDALCCHEPANTHKAISLVYPLNIDLFELQRCQY
ncbi:hypothetical protein GCM10009000_009150 [Halobacterium noricense]|uniref:Uncharacterized protein n=2 Tax=Haladaptatus pallidirubidus TaxID=1008152 RepID=A0AAV3UQX2_9EURY